MNTVWGQPGPQSYLRLTFAGGGGVRFEKELIGGIDIPDYNQGGYTNTIDGVHSRSAFDNGRGQRMDLIQVNLPPEFRQQTLDSIPSGILENGSASAASSGPYRCDNTAFARHQAIHRRQNYLNFRFSQHFPSSLGPRLGSTTHLLHQPWPRRSSALLARLATLPDLSSAALRDIVSRIWPDYPAGFCHRRTHMLTKRFVIIAAMAIVPVFAQTSDTPRFRAPIRDLIDHHDGSVTSTNWSGYAVTGSDFTRAEGSWIVPAVTCNSGTEYAVFWVGIDGYSSSTVEQTGTEAVCSGTTATYSAWYEFCCTEPIITIPSMTITPGDVMSAAINYSSTTGKFTVKIIDETTGQSYSKSQAVSGAQRSSAEWIAEAPSDDEVLPLADYGTVLFGEDSTNIAGTNAATDTTTHGVIGKFSTREQITMEKRGAKESIPSGLSSDGSSFSVMWAAE